MPLFQESVIRNPSLWTKALTSTTITWKEHIFSNVNTPTYDVAVCDSLWLNHDYKTLIMRQIADSPINPNQGYVYSDLHYYLYPEIIKNITGTDFDHYVGKTFLNLGSSSLVFNPYKSVSMDKIVPTEYDSLFRKSLIHGYVHDEGTAMMGGISGHAGLFGNANDLTKLMQMYLQKGHYGGHTYIDKDVIMECTSYQFPDEKNRRGIGFDKKDFDPKISNGPSLSSSKSFGHSGFTGTFTWVDPEYNLVYTFLSNRVYPTRNNSKISSLNIRTAIGDAIIKTIKKGL